MKTKNILPALPGVYLFKNKEGEVIYIGKATILRNRVQSYFREKSDWKTRALLEEYNDISFIITSSAMEAVLLETELIQKYQPKYNVLSKAGQPFLYLLFDKQPLPSLQLVRNKKQRGTYFGPFFHKTDARRVFNFLNRTFQLTLCKKKIAHGCLEYHLGICPGNCRDDFNPDDYVFRLQLAQEVLLNNQKSFLAKLKEKIQSHSSRQEFEQAKKLADYFHNFESIFNTIKTHYSQTKFASDIVAATTPPPLEQPIDLQLARDLQDFFKLDHVVRTIDCFDISHFQSRDLVGSCVRFTDGLPDKNKFRRFKVNSINRQNDYAALQEIVSRRYKTGEDIPDLILIDGGKGQLSAVRQVLPHAPLASLAKREETIFSQAHQNGIILDIKTAVGKTLIALRDYAHHFAISYHKLRRSKSQ